MPVFLSVGLFKACFKSFCYYLPVFRMGRAAFIFCEVVLFQKVDGFFFKYLVSPFCLSGAVSCLGHPFPSP